MHYAAYLVHVEVSRLCPVLHTHAIGEEFCHLIFLSVSCLQREKNVWVKMMKSVEKKNYDFRC